MTQHIEDDAVRGPRLYRNNDKLIGLGNTVWQAAHDVGLIGITVDHDSNNRLITGDGHEFMVLCSCSYLGLNRHPAVIQGGIDALTQWRTTGLSLAEVRVRLNLLKRLEEELREQFGGPVLPGVSCSALTAGILPLIASGHLGDNGRPRVMVFDRFSHFSMAYAKPICADETLVLTSPHNDMNYLEDICRKYPRVAYVADGAYSMGGVADVAGLLDLQDRYGLFLYFDDSHALSIHGSRGEGYVRSRIEMNPLTIVVASLAKAFGAAGGIAMLGDEALFDFLYRNAGPVAWSQNMEVAAIGHALGSLAVHRSPELAERQRRLQANIAYFDSQFPTDHAGNGLPIRKITVGEADRALRLSRELYEHGYYCSAVFFPIVARGEAGVRVMMRADIDPPELAAFCKSVKESVKESVASD